MIFFKIDRPSLQEWAPQIVIVLDLQRGRLRIVDNGGGLNPQQVRARARAGARARFTGSGSGSGRGWGGVEATRTMSAPHTLTSNPNLHPDQMKEWAECGNSTNRSRVTKMLEVNSKDPRVVGLCSNLISSYGIGGKGGGAALTREGKEVNGNITLFSCQGAEDDEPASLQKINFNLKEAQLRQVCAQPLRAPRCALATAPGPATPTRPPASAP